MDNPIKRAIYRFLLKHSDKFDRFIWAGLRKRLYAALTVSKTLGGSETEAKTGVMESLLGANEVAQSEVLGRFIFSKYPRGRDEWIEDQVLLTLTAPVTKGAAPTDEDERIFRNNLDMLFKIAKRRNQFLWWIYAILAITIICTMVVMISSGVVLMIVNGKAVWGASLAATGLAQFLALIWLPVSKLRKSTIESLQLDIVLNDYFAQLGRVDPTEELAEARKRKSEIAAAAVESLRSLLAQK